MVAAEAPANEAEASEDSGTYVVQNAAERRGVIEALIYVSEEPLGAMPDPTEVVLLKPDHAVANGTRIG